MGPGSVPSYDLFEFALIHVAAKSKGPPEIGCSLHNCIPKEDRGNASIDHCFLETERFGSENRKKTPPFWLPKPQGAQLFQDRLSSAVPRQTLPSFPQTQSGGVCID